jgi:large subunit ribosomal protein L17
MRHGKKINHLGRTSSHRKAMMANMASSLILHKRINTTTAKAKALKTFVEPLITRAKTDNTHSRRVVFSYLQNKDAVSELFRDVAEKIGDRPGGYTRILKTGNRKGDNAEMCFMELVDYNETYTSTETKQSSSKRRRRRRGGKKKSQTQQKDQEAAEQQTTESSGQEPEATESAGSQSVSETSQEKAPTEEKSGETTVESKTESPEAQQEDKSKNDQEDQEEQEKKNNSDKKKEE